MAVRQWSKTLDQVREDHRFRYEWAAELLSGGDVVSVLDAACGCGYGSRILADDGYIVTGVDLSRRALAFAQKHWSHECIEYVRGNLDVGVIDISNPGRGLFTDAVVSFETIEHLVDPVPFLDYCKSNSYRLLLSVPNEDVIPFSKDAFPYHHRHYTLQEITDLIATLGGHVRAWYGQAGKTSRVEPETNGRTIVLDVVWL